MGDISRQEFEQAESSVHAPGSTLNHALGVAMAQFGETNTRLVCWASWTDAFGSTAGPRGGAGGQMVTVFQVYAFIHEDGRAIKYCAGVWKKWDGIVGSKW